SGCQPYQLTQRFIGPDANGVLTRFAHRAPWLDEGQQPGGPSHRLYRLFEFLQTGTTAPGVAPLGGIAGKVNLNTIWDAETFRALCGTSASGSFDARTVDDVFARGIYDRPGTTTSAWRRTAGRIPGRGDQ